ncbi:RHS repeat protein [Poritiphilus flavus]|uniref:YD repeat-containing protein n=1 Tax=Poritiphilus flavus TaxID=2697053 RepID=A0A6L9EJT1_9FLAO|nr:RHS repeat domain-containing protein [Poritiphilus flavus]NAS14459.1 hypothetical protein [Poritiphilus flavus]
MTINANRKRTEIFTVLLFLLLTSSFSQQSTFDLPNYHPVSPNAASLGKFGLYPVNKSLGTANVNIPIYTLSERGLTVPINLNYNTSGIRLNDLASWVGLGWSLDAGGAIVRNVKGLPDKTYNSNIPNLQNAAFSQTNYNYLLGATNGLRDTAPDQYVLNALGRTATFYFDQNKGFKAVFEDGSPIEISVVSADEIHAILEDGTLLIFGKEKDGTLATEVTNHHNASYTFDYISAWYLTSLVSQDRQQSISFEYKSLGKQSGYSEPASETIYIDGSFLPSVAHLYLKAAYQELVVTSRKFLEKIVFNNGHIDFESSLGRTDLADDYQLDAIKIYTNDDTANGKLIDQFHFNYDYFQRSGGNFSRDYDNAPIFFDSTKQTNSRTKALKLTSVYRGASISSGEVHHFSYKATTLPERCTTAQDSWGYPNDNTGTLLPQTQVWLKGTIGSTLYTIGNGNRSTDEDSMKAAILKKITYPTGGYTIFEFEANRLTTSDIVYAAKSSSATAYGSECTDPGYPHLEETTFTIPQGAKNIKLHIDMSPVLYQGSSISYLALDNKYFYRPTPSSISGSPSDSSDGWTETIHLPFGSNLGDVLNPVPFESGTHVLKAFDSGYGPFAAYPCSRMGITITWDEPNGTQEVEKLVGGLRVKSISNYDGNSVNPVLVKKFEYETPDLIHPEENRGYQRTIILDPNFSLNPVVSTSPHFNNNLGGEPVISYEKVTEYEYDLSSATKNGKTISYYENVPRWRTLNSLVGPETFRHSEYSWSYFYSQALSNGDTWSLMAQQMLQDALGGPGQFSFYESTSWKRNKLKSEEKYKTENGIDVILSKIENIYETIETNKIYSNYVFTPYGSPYPSWQVPDYSPYDQGTDLSSIQFCYQIGEIETGRRVLKQTTESLYDNSGQNPLTTVTQYFYDNLTHKQPTKTIVQTSQGNVVETITSYPDDILTTASLGQPNLDAAGLSAINKLKKPSSTNLSSLHRITEPIQVKKLIKDSDGVVLSSTVRRTDYVDKGNNLVLPKAVRSLKGTYNSSSNPMEERIIYSQYDNHGNILEIKKSDGTPVSYIWGFNKMFPVAVAENASYTQVATVLNGIAGLDLNTNGLTEAQATTLRSNLPGAMVTTYTYDLLVGVTSITDPRGNTTYYSYDDFNRLKEVRDADNKLLSDYQYHYKGQ